MAYEFLPAQHAYLVDGNVSVTFPVGSPRVLVFGNAGKGLTYQPYNIAADALSQSINQFGLDGNLARQAYECREGGGEAIVLNRVGALPLKLGFIGGTGEDLAERVTGSDGLTIECKYGGTEWSTRFGIAYEVGSNRLIIEDKSLNVVVYDNGTENPVDLGLFNVEGTFATDTGGTDIGNLGATPTLRTSIAISLSTASDLSMSYCAGDNGTNHGKMRLDEALYKGIKSMEGVVYDFISFPEKATLNATYSTNFTAQWTSRGTTYPGITSAGDKLGKVFVEEVNGQFHHYWDLNGDNAAEIWSVEGTSTSAHTGTSLGGHVFNATSFREANFAYLLSDACYQITENDQFVQGIIGVEDRLVSELVLHMAG